MTKTQLIEALAKKQEDLTHQDIRVAVDIILNCMIEGLSVGKRVEIRGFGSLTLRYRPPRHGRNPKTGEAVEVAGKYFPHFKPGRELKQRVNIPPDAPGRSSGN